MRCVYLLPYPVPAVPINNTNRAMAMMPQNPTLSKKSASSTRLDGEALTWIIVGVVGDDVVDPFSREEVVGDVGGKLRR